LLYKDRNKEDEAISLLKDAVEKEKNEPSAYNLLGWLYWKKGNMDEAQEVYSNSIEIDPNQEDAQYNIGILYYNKGKADQAKEAFGKVLQLNPSHEKAASYLAHLGDKQFLGKPEYANLLIPDPSLRHCYLGKQYLDNKQYAEAALEYETALETNPKCIEAQQGLGVTYEYNDKGVRYGDGFRIEKSIFHYEKALALNPKLAEAVFNVGVLYSMKNRVNDAIRYYLRLIREDSNNAIAHYNLAVLYDNKTKNKERAVFHYTKYIKLEPESTKRNEIEKRIRKLRI
jgi:superkiller protein 3